MKQNIIEDINNNVSKNEIIDKYKISKATYFRIQKQIKENNEVSENISNNISNNNISQINDSVNNDTNNETENDNETEDQKSEFNIETFKKELNNNSNNNIQKNDILSEKSFISQKSYKSNKTFVSNKSISFSRKKDFNNFKIPDQNQKQKTENIINVIKNTNIDNSNIEEIKEKRHHIIIIKQYFDIFDKDLISIYGNNRLNFEKSLFTLNLDQLKLILENIRTIINIKQNKTNFITISSNIIKGIETISTYSGYDVSGLEQQLLGNPEFIMDLNILSAETDVSKYLNPKSSVFLKIIRAMYQINNEHKIKKQFNDVMNDPKKLELIKNLEK